MGKEAIVLTVLFIFFLLIPLNSAQVLISEIMPHTNNTWTNEWVELYNPAEDTLNISLWKVGDKSSNDTFSIIVYPKSFALIVDEDNVRDNLTGCNSFNISNDSCFQLPSIGSGLNDENETLFLYDNLNNLIENVSWQESIKSTGKSSSLNNSVWSICKPTPGEQNNCTTPVQNQTNETNQTISIIPEISMLFPSQVYNNKTNFTITIDFINFSQGVYDLKVDIKNGTKYLNRFWTIDSWTDKNSWIDNFTYINSTNLTQNIINIIDTDMYFIGNASLQLKIRNSTFEVYSNIFYINIINGTFQENQKNVTNESNDDQKENNQEKSSDIRITDFPETAKFGSEIKIKLDIYRGNTSKYAVYAYVEKDNERVSDKTTIHVNSKYSEYKGTLGINLDCKNESGDYKIVVEGLDEKDTETVSIESCYEEDISDTGTNTNNNQDTTSNNISSNFYKNNINNQDIISQNSLVTGSSINNTEQRDALSFMKILPFVLGLFLFSLVGYFLLKKY
jgi:hypothetical protein